MFIYEKVLHKRLRDDDIKFVPLYPTAAEKEVNFEVISNALPKSGIEVTDVDHTNREFYKNRFAYFFLNHFLGHVVFSLICLNSLEALIKAIGHVKNVCALTLADIIEMADNGLSGKDEKAARLYGLILRQVHNLNKNELKEQKDTSKEIYDCGYGLCDGKVDNKSLGGGGNQPLSIESALAWARVLMGMHMMKKGAIVICHVSK